MKKIGIIGGIGWPSTMEYYRLICEASQKHHQNKTFSGPSPMPEIAIESLNMHFTVNNRGTSELGSWCTWDSYFQRACRRLEQSGAELILLASVTPHARLEVISEGINVPVISVYEAIGLHCKTRGIDNLLVLGTMPTMTSQAFKNGVAKFGVNTIYPPTEELKTRVTEVIERLYQNQIEGSSVAIDSIVRASLPSDQLDTTVTCLACTELPTGFRDASDKSEFEYKGIQYINSSVLHAISAFDACIS